MSVFDFQAKNGSGVTRKDSIEAVDQNEAVKKLQEDGLIVISIEERKTKKCPFCAETDLQIDAKICKHCGRNVEEAGKPYYARNIGCSSILAVCFVIAGFFYWPLWIIAVLLFILAGIYKSR